LARLEEEGLANVHDLRSALSSATNSNALRHKPASPRTTSSC
jgi:hypothetical protein